MVQGWGGAVSEVGLCVCGGAGPCLTRAVSGAGPCLGAGLCRLVGGSYLSCRRS